MADVSGKFFSAKKVRTGVSPSSPGVEVGETLPPVNPPGTSLNSVGLTMPSAFAVANSPLTSNGTIAVTGAGTVAQYVRGDGTLADFPESSGGGSSVSYYLNGSVSQGTIGGVAYREMNKVPILGAGTDFTIAANGYISSFITDAGDPNLLEIPGGNWNFESYFSASSGGGSPTFYVELYKVNAGGTATLIASNSANPELISFGTTIAPYFSSLAVPTTVLALTDRLAVRYYVTHSGRTITLHTEGPHLCQIITTFTTGLTALNGLTAQVQFFAVGTSGTDFNIASATATHTFNLPTASATNRGALSSADWALFTQAYNDKINSASVTGTTTKTLTLTQQDGGEITASWTDLNTDAVISVFGRTGAVVAVSGDYTTAQVTESGNLYYTDGRARGALSFAAGSGAYNSSTGVITIPTNNNQIANGAGYITSAALAAYLPLTGGTLTGPLGGTSISLSGDITANRYRGVNSLVLNTYTTVNPSSNVYLYSPPADRDAWIYLDSADTGSNWGIYHRQIDSAVSGLPANSIGFIGGGTNTLQAWISLLNGNGFFAGSLTASNLSGTNTGNVTIGTANGLSLSGQALSLGLASGSANGALSSTDWTTFNNKQNALTNPVTGTGTPNIIPKFINSNTLGNSSLQELNGNLSIGVGSPAWSGFLALNIYGQSISASSGAIILARNWYFDNVGTGEKYFENGTAQRLELVLNRFVFQTAANNSSGAGATLAWNTQMTLFETGNLTLGSTADANFKLDVNGTGRFSDNLRISKSSNSGSGSGFPRFTVQNTLATQGDGSSTFNFADINISSGNEAVNMFLATTFAAGTWAPAGIINVATNHELQFKTNNTTRLTLANSGAATFTSSVTATQFIASGGNNTTVFNSTSATTGWVQMAMNNTSGSALLGVENSSGGSLATGTSAYATVLRNYTNTDLQIATNNIVRITITSGGNVGIGTPAPSTKTHIVGSASTGGVLRIENNQNQADVNHGIINLVNTRAHAIGNDASIMFSGFDSGGSMHPRASIGMKVSSSSVAGDLVFNTRSDSTFTEKMRIASGGIITINNLAGSGNRIVVANSGGTLITAVIGSGLAFDGTTLTATGGSSGSITGSGSSGTIALFTGGTSIGNSVITQLSSNILIGTGTDSGYKLNVNGTGMFTPTSSASVPTLMLNQGAAYGNIAGLDMYHGLILRGIPAAAGDYSVTATDQISFYEFGGIFNFYKKQPGVLLRQAYIDNGSFYGASFFETSDATIKTLVQDDYQAKGIDSVVAKLYIKNGKQELGYFAQDLQGILPSAVNKGSDGLLNLSYREVHTAKIAYLEEEIRQIKKRYEIN
jgi:hypothetical protein